MNDLMESPVSHAGNKATGADTLSAVLPRQLESTCAFGSMIVCEPDRLKRVGCHGPVIAWLSPGDETWGMHAEGAAMSRAKDAQGLIAKWEQVIDLLDGIRRGDASRDEASASIREMEMMVDRIGRRGEGAQRLFATARALAAVI